MIAVAQLERDLYRTLTSVTFDDFRKAAGAFTGSYQKFASQVTSGTGGGPTNVGAGAAQLEAALTGAYATRSLPGTAAVLWQGLIAFWQIQSWAGGAGPGQTTAPGHAGVQPALTRLFLTGTGQGNARFHARELARICAMGVTQVVITEYPPGESPKVTTAV